MFQGVRVKKLPRPAGREGREVDVVRAWIVEGRDREGRGREAGGKGGWYV